MYGSALDQCLPNLPDQQNHVQYLFKRSAPDPTLLIHNLQRRTLNSCIVLKVLQVILMTKRAWETFQEKISSFRKEPYFTNFHITSLHLAHRMND